MMICVESNHERISFAGDLGQSDKAAFTDQQQPLSPVRRDTTLLDSSNSDFEFHISRSFDPGDSSPADDIFADGKILPFQVRAASAMPKRLYKYELPPIVSTPSLPSSSFPPPSLPQQSRKYNNEKETRGSRNCRGSGVNSDLEADKSSKSFWSFKRSSSLNCDIKKRLICSIYRLRRRSSTGSLTNSKRAMLGDTNKNSSLRHGVPRQGSNLSSHLPSSSSPSPSSLCCSSYRFMTQKNSGKNGGRGGVESFRIAPAIGGPSMSGLGSILRLSKEKKKK